MTQATTKTPRKIAEPIKVQSTGARPAKAPSHDEISNRARAIWESKGCPAGMDEQIWLEAEAQLKRGI
jgi:hypothetical protein